MNKEKLEYKFSLIESVISIIVSSLVLYFILVIFGVTKDNNFLPVVIAVMLISLANWLAQPLFKFLVRIFGVLGILLVGLFSSALLVWLVFSIIPSIRTESFLDSFLIAWIYSIVLTVLNWAILSNSNSNLMFEAIRHASKDSISASNKPGFIFLQFDGVSSEIMDMQIKAGNLPNISKLINEQDFILTPWHVQLPSTTPASQAGILHGNNNGIPAFRWYEKNKQELVVANQAKGAKLIEERLSNGEGLLADGGVSLGNLFSGDAETNIMVMSHLGSKGKSLGSMTEYSRYLSTPYGFMRSLTLSVGEIFKEFYQSRKQKSQNVIPSVDRKFSYAVLRAATNVLLRDLQTTIVIDYMMRGVNSLYVDYLDYDEVAHHAGVSRPESLNSLYGMDGALGLIMESRKYTTRNYEIVIVSDHGQSQGRTFKQLHNGKTLQDFIEELTNENVLTMPEEESSREAENSVSGKVKNPEIIVTGSGNLGNIWFPKISGKADESEINKIYPELIKSIVDLEGIGLLIVRKSKNVHVAYSKGGSIEIETKTIKGKNPLSLYPDLTIEDLVKLVSMQNAPDICVISSFNKITGEVHAFEELVGNHGGSGGWQTKGVILHSKKLKPSELYMSKGKIVGSENVHNIFVDWLKAAGHRKFSKS